MNRLVFVVAVIMAVINCIYAGETQRDSLFVRRVYDIEGIKVVAESIDKTIGIVDQKELTPETIQTDLSIGTLIKDMPGVFLTERGKGESVVRFRAFQDRHIRVFIDGMPISDGYFGKYDLHLISVNNVSMVQLIKGPVSHQFGFNTMGGILNIVTDDLNEENVLRFKSIYSSHGKTQSTLNSSFALGRSQLYLNSSYLNDRGFILPRKLQPLGDNTVESGGERRVNSSREQYNTNLRLVTDISFIDALTIAAGYSYMPNKGNPPSIYEHTDNRYSNLEDWSKLNLSLAAKSYLLDPLMITFSTYLDKSEDTYLSYNNSRFEKVLWSSLIRTQTLGLHLNMKYDIYDFINSDLGIRTEVRSYERSGGPGYEDIWVDNEQSISKIYYSMSFPFDKISFNMGNGISTFNHSRTKHIKCYWEPQASLVFRQNKQTFSLAHGIAYQFPTMHQLFSDFSGNTIVKPEKAYKSEASFRTTMANQYATGTLSLIFFYNRIDNIIMQDRMSFYNLKRMSTYGSELAFKMNIFNNFNQSYDIALTKLDKNSSSTEIMEYPETMLRLSNELKLFDKLLISQSSQWFSKTYTYYREQDYYRIPSYLIHHIGFKYFLNNSSITVNVKNIMDKYYEPQYGYPAAGREIILALEVPFI